MNFAQIALGWVAPVFVIQGLTDLLRKQYGAFILWFSLGVFFVAAWYWSMTRLFAGFGSSSGSEPIATVMVWIAPLGYCTIWILNNVRYAKMWISYLEVERKHISK